MVSHVSYGLPSEKCGANHTHRRPSHHIVDPPTTLNFPSPLHFLSSFLSLSSTSFSLFFLLFLLFLSFFSNLSDSLSLFLSLVTFFLPVQVICFCCPASAFRIKRNWMGVEGNQPSGKKYFNTFTVSSAFLKRRSNLYKKVPM